TPRAIPAVRRAAAAARQLLQSAGKQDYAELAKSPGIAEAYQSNLPADIKLTPATEWRALGTPLGRINGRDIVTGAHHFPSDIVRPNMLYGSVLRPPSYGATLENVDPAAARKLAGVTVVRDGEFTGCTAPTRFAAR